MGNIKIFCKWDLEKGVWVKNPNSKLYGRSFAIANYDRIITNNEKINYIIINYGSRVEDHSKGSLYIREKEAVIINIINHYKKCNGNYDIKLFLMDADAPIIEDAKLFAKYIDYLASLPSTNSINIIGFSKCGVMNFYVPSFFDNIGTFNKTNIYNIATPYDGAMLASPLIVYPEIKKIISGGINNEKLINFIYDRLIKVYESISSNSHMDYDIAIPGGIPDDKKEIYDESFIKNVFSSNNIESINKINVFKNFFTSIDSNTLKEAIKTMNFVGIGLCILDDFLFNNKSDGMVNVSSQKKVDDILNIESYQLISAHHDVCNNVRAINEVLNIVDNTIEEFNKKSLKK